MIDVHEPTERERGVATTVRNLATAEIRRLSDLAVAESLGLRQAGLDALLATPVWDLTTATRVAEAVELPAVTAIEEARMAADSAIEPIEAFLTPGYRAPESQGERVGHKLDCSRLGGGPADAQVCVPICLTAKPLDQISFSRPQPFGST